MIDPETLNHIERLSARVTTWRTLCWIALAYAAGMTVVAVIATWRCRL